MRCLECQVFPFAPLRLHAATIRTKTVLDLLNVAPFVAISEQVEQGAKTKSQSKPTVLWFYPDQQQKR